MKITKAMRTEKKFLKDNAKKEKLEKLIEERRRALSRAIEEAVERLGYECVHVGMKTDSSRLRLQVLIDSLGGINLEDCETVSKSLNRLLDELDTKASSPLPGLEEHYYLEVSSPGIERPLFTLSHYERFAGEEARLRLSEPVMGRKTLTGRIAGADDRGVELYIQDDAAGGEEKILIPLGSIKSGNLIFRGFEPGTPQKNNKKGRKNRTHREEEL